jgi:HPt (histidine-containing phosphotransfer) domain-containing protein
VTAEKLSGAVDFAYLEGFVAGDIAVVLEVLALFRQQAEGWSATLDGRTDGWRDVAHTIKGAARGVGANALADAADRAEFGAADDLPAVKAALDAAVADIAAYQALKASQTPNS